MNKSKFEKSVNCPKNIILSFSSTEINILPINGHPLRATIKKQTETDYTEKNAAAIRAWLDQNEQTMAGWAYEIGLKEKQKAEERKAFLKTPEGKKSLARDQALALAKTAGLNEEHGSSRGDWHTLSVKDVVFGKKELAALHASGKILALVSDFRKRVYAKSYKHAPSTREDFYLVGTNENKISFCHAVSRNCATVADAISWIWGGSPITARHGDIAITPAKFSGNGETVSNISMHDSHHFTGEMHKNGGIYVRNGILHHMKNQHPDVVIGTDWMKVLIAKRASAGGSRD